MKIIRWMVCLAAFVMLAATSQAQKETWLDYRTSADGDGYRWLDLSTNPPPNVVLPKLTATPLFARWTTPMDTNGGRWLCFDRTRKSGPYNRVYADINGNGRLDDKTPIDSTQVDTMSAYFPPIRFTLNGDDGPVAYHLNFRFLKYSDSDNRLLISSGGSYQGKVELAGKKRDVRLVDGNVNGIFNDVLPNTDCDRVVIDNSDSRYLGKLIDVDNQYYRIEVARDGAFIKVQKADDLTLGDVRVPETISSISVVGENGQFTRKLTNGTFSIPVGKYKIYTWSINRKDAKGVSWEMSGYGFGDSGAFEVASGKPAVLEVGEPVRATIAASESSDRQIQFNLQFRGHNGESIQFTRENQQPPGPKLTISTLDGKLCHTNKFDFG